MKGSRHTVLLCTDAVAFGLFAAWLAYSLAPMWPIAGEPQDNLGLYLPARVFFYGAFVISTMLVDASGRLQSGRDPAPRRKALVAIGVASQLVTGILGWWYKHASGQGDFWIVASFVLSGAVTPLLQTAWIAKLGERVRERPRVFALCAAAAAVAALGLLASASVPNDLLYSFLPLGSLVLLVPTRPERPPLGNPGTSGGPEIHATQDGPAPSLVLGGVACALAGSHVFNGTAEFGTFLQRGTILCGIFVGVAAAVAVAAVARRSRTGIVAVLTAGTVVMMSSIATQGLVVNATGSLDGVFGRGLHLTVLAGEYLTYALGLFIASEFSGTTGHGRGPALAPVNGGVAVGAVAGILVTADVLTYTVLSFAFSSAALLLLGISWGMRYAQSKEPAPRTDGSDPALFEERYALSEREREVFRLWVSGHQLDYVSEALCISRNTVKTHVSHIYKKTGAKNREELIQLYESGRGARP